jgi:myo-inositol-1(or 4)-monophosphatase
MGPHSNSETLQRIHDALEAARVILNEFTPGAVATKYKSGDDPVTAADHAVDAVLRKNLLRDGEGWLSEETVDDPSRLEKSRVWVVDPLDGTREFVAGIPEFCVSIAMVDNGIPIAGGICNPATNETFIGSLESGVTYNGKPAKPSQRTSLHGASVLASRSETKRGEWDAFIKGSDLNVISMGSVAYKLARVSAGLADVTFTLTPKNEWDVAAGAALVTAAGGYVQTLENTPLKCNRKDPLLSGLIACAPGLRNELVALLSDHLQPAARR